MQIKKVAVIGAGQMGNGIAHVLSLGGYDVVLNDIDKIFLLTAILNRWLYLVFEFKFFFINFKISDFKDVLVIE